MKSIKKMSALLLAVILCLGMCLTAFAADSSTITIENSVNQKIYHVYKIFDATYSTDDDGKAAGAVSYTLAPDSVWVTSGAIEEESFQAVFTATPVFKAGSTTEVDYYAITKAEDAEDEDVISWLKQVIAVDNDPESPEFGTATVKIGDIQFTITETAEKTGNGGALTFSSLPAGYYFITTTNGSVVSVTSASPDAVIIDKNQQPGSDLTKDILVYHEPDNEHPDGWYEHVKAEDEVIGDSVTFEISSYVPLYDGDQVVTEYLFEDTMSEGLVIDLSELWNLDLIIWGVDVDGNEGFQLSTDSDQINAWVTLTNSSGDGSVSFTDQVYDWSLTFTDVDEEHQTAGGFSLKYYTYDREEYEASGEFVTSLYPTDATLRIVYTAQITEDAVYDNTNDIAMDWKVTNWDSPNPENPADGEGAKEHDDVYTWELELVKIDGNGGSPLSGAVFTLAGTNLVDVRVSTSYTYTLKETLEEPYEGYETTEYYKLASGEFTTVPPTDSGADPDDYDTVPGPYLRSAVTHTEHASVDDHLVQGTTDANGVLTFAGLMSGEYTITEIMAPDGYNLLEKPISFTISWNPTDGQFSMSDVEGTSGNAVYDVKTGIFTFEIENNAGMELPGTGGMGTTLFYILGAVLVCSAGVLLITRRRMRHGE